MKDKISQITLRKCTKGVFQGYPVVFYRNGLTDGSIMRYIKHLANSKSSMFFHNECTVPASKEECQETLDALFIDGGKYKICKNITQLIKKSR